MKLPLLIAFTILATAFCFSQTWTGNNPVWYFSYQGTADNGFIKIQHTGDSLIDGISCQELTAVKHMFYNTGPDGNVGHSALPYGVNYVYTSNDTVFYRENGTFKVLFDFAAQQGNSWLLSSSGYGFGCSDTSYTIVDSVSSVNFGTETAVKLVLSAAAGQSNYQAGSYNSHFGSMDAYLFPQPNSCDSNIIVDFDILSFCSFQDDELTYPAGAECDYKLTHLSVTENGKLNFEVYPNPAADVLSLKLNAGEYRYRILSTSGVLVGEAGINSENPTFSISDLENGIYIIELTSDSSSGRSVFLKQ